MHQWLHKELMVVFLQGRTGAPGLPGKPGLPGWPGPEGPKVGLVLSPAAEF